MMKLHGVATMSTEAYSCSGRPMILRNLLTGLVKISYTGHPGWGEGVRTLRPHGQLRPWNEKADLRLGGRGVPTPECKQFCHLRLIAYTLSPLIQLCTG